MTFRSSTSPTLLLLLLAAMLPLTASCGDAVSPVHAQTVELAQIQAQLETVLEKLNSIEEDHGQALTQLGEELGTLGSTVNQLAVGVGASVGASAAVEGSICAKSSLAAESKYQALFQVRGQADGMVGVDAYGNGANATLRGYLAQKLDLGVNPGIGLEMQLCGKVTGQTGIDGGVSIDASDPVIALLQDLTSSVSTSDLTGVASTVGMDGSRTGQALNLLGSLSPSGISSSFSGGGGSALAGALPLPPALRARVEDPTSILDDAASIGSASIDLLCSGEMRVGEFASLMSSGCDLRDQMPPPADVVDIVSNLDGLQLTLGDLQSSLGTLETSFASLDGRFATVCNRVGSMTGQRLTIPSRSVTILGTSYTTFPGYSAALFPSIGAPTC